MADPTGTINTELLADLPGHLAKGQRHPDPVLTLPDLDAAVGAFIATNYHQREHPEIHTSPLQAWNGDGWLPRLPATIDDLNLLLLTVAKTRIVHRDGVHFQGLRYVSPLLAAYVKEPVVIRYDPRDIAEIRIFHKGPIHLQSRRPRARIVHNCQRPWNLFRPSGPSRVSRAERDRRIVAWNRRYTS